ncbi:putative g protein-coupled receptor : ste3 (pheromone receptor) sequence protein [Botrytis fragariae]|uniref:Putative g protein-coupled receptor: ste3 (Pheromone receptor) sequence protein n=1 Tax=Botrytis fragariae TaxID=1964551 RepID=A0A8H6ATS4_9HELO|nr:putative g protein-coupled receptor : ste3 (pheromone receptor) sequence protein [Botrytis fragariae]KAF5873349.1 putative g protein-coupled receptor : ste3 (pheromone receptor) sequence protein [Botrytis fragariae]
MSAIISTGPDSPGVNYPISANAITLPIFSIIFILLLIVPFRLLYRVSNIAACSLVIINMISLIFVAMNALIWPTDSLASRFSGHVVCDIQVLIRQALYTAMTSTTCCISLFLARAVNTDNACMHETRAMKRRRVAKDCAFCFTIPILQVALHYTIQTNRFMVMTIYGCVDATDLSSPSIVILHIWPLIFACMNCYFAFLVIYRLRRHRTNFTSTLSSSSSGLSPRRFFKLFSMSLIILLIYFPVVIYYFYLNVSWPLHAYSWSYIHDPSYWHSIVFWRIVDAPKGMQYDAWNWVALAFLIVVFWGCNSEGLEIYRRGLNKLGLARCWPRLRMSTHERKAEKMERDSRIGISSGSVNGSWAGKFDLITKTIHYFEDQEAKSRKHSVATTTTLGDEVTNTTSRKPSHTPAYDSVNSSNSACNSHNTTGYNPSLHKPSNATTFETIIEKETSISSTSTTCDNSDAISPLPRMLGPNNANSHFPDHELGGREDTIPPPTSTRMWGIFRKHLNPLSLASSFVYGKKANSQDSNARYHSHSKSNSAVHPNANLDPTIANQNSTHTTQIWAAGALQDPNDLHKGSNAGLSVTGDSTKSLRDYANEEEHDQHDLLAKPKPGTRAYRERERREMISERQERKKVMEKKISGPDEQGNKNRGRVGEGLNVERTFDIVEERNIGRASGS